MMAFWLEQGEYLLRIRWPGPRLGRENGRVKNLFFPERPRRRHLPE